VRGLTTQQQDLRKEGRLPGSRWCYRIVTLGVQPRRDCAYEARAFRFSMPGMALLNASYIEELLIWELNISERRQGSEGTPIKHLTPTTDIDTIVTKVISGQ